MKGILSLRGFRKLRTGAIVATGVFLFATSNVQVVQASEEDGVWEARTVEQVKADIASLAKDSNYVIKWGDTLSVISEATGISMDALAQMNQITNVNLIYAHNELGFTQPISTTTGNQTVSKQTVTVVNRQNKKEEVKAFEVTTKEDTQSGKTETVVTEVKPTTKEEKTVPKTGQVLEVTTKEEASKVNQTLVSSQPAEKAVTISKAETAKVDQTLTTGKVEAKKVDQATAVVKPVEASVTTEVNESTSSNPVEEKKQIKGTVAKKETEGEVEKKETTSTTEKSITVTTTSEEVQTSPTPAEKSEEKVENSVPATNKEESTTVEKQTEINKDQASTVEKSAEASVATETKEVTPSNSVEEKKETEGTVAKETKEEKVDNKEVTSSTDKTSKGNPTSEEAPVSQTSAAESEGKAENLAPATNGEESTTVEKQTEINKDQEPAAVVNPAETPVATDAKESTPSNQTEEKEDKQIEQPTTNTPSKDSVENNEIAPSTNNSSNEGEKHEEEKKDETVVPKEVTQENKDALDSHKQIKLKEINESSLTPEQKEQAITKVKELTTKAEKDIEGAATSEEQAKVVDQYEKDLIAIATPKIETPKPDFTKPIESHNPTGSTTIGEGGAISTLASSTPAVSESAANTPVVSTPSTASAPAASTPATSEPTASASAESIPATSVPTVSTPVESVPATSEPTASASAESIPATSTPVESVPEASTPAPSKPTSTEATSSPSTATNPSVSDTSASNTNSENTGFRNAPTYQPRVVRRARSVDAPKDQVAIYYNFAEMKDIAGFLGDPGESIITVPDGASSDVIRTIVKAKIDAKKAELAKRGYTFMEDYFVDKPQEDTIRYDYVVNFTKAASASEQATSTATPSAPVVSESAAPSVPVTNETAASTPAESTPTTSVPATSVPTASTPAPSTPTSTEAASSPSTTTNRSVSDTSASNTSLEHTAFRNVPTYQPRVVRRARSVDAPKDQVAIYYNFAEMKDIAGFLGDPGESIITVPAGASSDEIRTIVKAKIDAKKAELAKRGYTFMEDYFVDKPQEDTIRYDYVVNFTKAASLRVAPVSQPRAARNRRSVVESPVKTRTITFYYQLAGLEIAGALGTPGKNYVITVPETASTTEIQQAIDDATRSEKAELGRFFKYVRETNLQTDILDRGFGNFDYVITFTR